MSQQPEVRQIVVSEADMAKWNCWAEWGQRMLGGAEDMKQLRIAGMALGQAANIPADVAMALLAAGCVVNKVGFVVDEIRAKGIMIAPSEMPPMSDELRAVLRGVGLVPEDEQEHGPINTREDMLRRAQAAGLVIPP